MTCVEFLRAGGIRPEPLVQVVIGLYWTTYQHYATLSYKGVSDYDVYILLVHLTSWLVEYANSTTQDQLTEENMQIILNVPSFRTKKVNYSAKQESVARNTDAANARTFE